jgi:tRNA-2-methylthio-N6-dimethylallyladenosine synthase
MKRSYTVEHYRQLVTEIRSRIPTVALSTDIIVGFPTESEPQFQQTIGLLTELRFDIVHVAAYSPRAGTLASRQFEDDVQLAEKQERLEKVEQLQESIAAKINAQLLGKIDGVLVEGKKEDKWWGRTRSGKLVFFSGDNDCQRQLMQIRIDKTSPWSLQGGLLAGSTN